MTIFIRAASPNDAATLFGLIRDHAAFERNSASLTIGELEAIVGLDNPPIRLLVAASETVLVGYAAITFDWSLWRARRYCHLDCLFVVAAARSRGIGKMLLNEAAKITNAEGLNCLESDACVEQGRSTFLRSGRSTRYIKGTVHDECAQGRP